MLVFLACGAGAAEAQEPLDGLLLKTAPPGWVATTREAADPSEIGGIGSGRTQVFERPGELVVLTLWDPTGDRRGTELAYGLKSAAARREAPFDAGPGRVGWSAVVDGQTVHGVLARHDGLIVDAQLVAGVPASTAAATLRTFVDAQLARPSVPAPVPHVPDQARYLYDQLIDSPGEGYVLLPGVSGLVTVEQLRAIQTDERAVQAYAKLQEVARQVARHWASPEVGPEVRITLTDAATSQDARALLSVLARAGTFDRGSQTLIQEHDGVFVRTGRRGQYLVSVAVIGEQPREEKQALAGRLLAAQTAVIEAPERGDPSFSELFGYVVGTFGVLALIRMLAARVKRRRLGIEGSQGDHSVAPHAVALRKKGLALGVALALLASAALTAWLFAWPASVIAALLIPVAVWVSRRADRRGVRLGLRRPRLIRSAAIGTVSVLVLAIAALLVLTAAMISVFGPTLSQADLEREGLNLTSLGSFAALTLPIVAVLLFRVARREARLRADELRKLDRRRQVLYLRGFRDDKLRIPTIVSGRRPTLELLSPIPTERYEEVVAWELGGLGPVVAIAPPGSGLGSLGAARELVPLDVEWQEFVAREIGRSGLIVMSLATSEGALWELGHLAERGLLERLLILFPPVGADELRARWQVAAGALGAELPIDPAVALVAIFVDGRLVPFSADVRDEAGYRAAIRAAAERLAVSREAGAVAV